nr:diamine oxidase, histaminase, PK-DAO=amiloride-binding protein {N-terminal} {EC 1.4.3.6} [swine, kidney, Peptide Partial, 20 aa] [Sus scrofa]
TPGPKAGVFAAGVAEDLKAV